MWNYIRNNEAIAVAILSTIAYVASYIFEYGYANFYGIPKELISISLGNIITMSMTLFLASYIFFILCSIPILIMGRCFKNIYLSVTLPRALSFFIFVTLILYLNGAASYTNLKQTFYIIAAMFGMASLMFSLKEKEKEKEETPEKKTSLFNIVDTTLSSLFIAGAAILIFILSCGTFIARTTLPLGIIELNGNEYSIIRIYGENFIALKTPPSSQTKNTKNNIYIFKSEDFKYKPIVTHKNHDSVNNNNVIKK